ncbi:MAG: hypothetical protein HUU14_07055 [Dehalococcoidia bacterium]|nr:hypothetical protein [Chloroflexi bacterium CFX7]MCK6565678.1 hypothetical protein [Dehalococcoidia bacterium]MCL4231373.1 hypothetical protein [Dehalococcoidia bacterium]NUQ55624.1 hypothetical protein [Dehalococcoidia bacterium]
MPFFRRGAAERRVAEAIRQGIGVREFTWEAPAAGDTHARRRAIEAILASIREAMGSMRRPYGINHVAVALACRDHQGRVVCSNTLGVLRPESFYGDGSEARIAAFLDDVESVPGERRARIDGALLSLGDLAFELSLRTAA